VALGAAGGNGGGVSVAVELAIGELVGVMEAVAEVELTVRVAEGLRVRFWVALGEGVGDNVKVGVGDCVSC